MNSILETYPHATEVVRDWFIDKMEESFKDNGIPDNFKEFMRQQGVPNDKLVGLFEDNPRVLFDVFDDNDVIINIMHNDDGFIWDVNNVKNIEIYASRKMAEKAAVQRAFQILNNKLNITLNEGQDSGTSDSEVSA
jgi:hypothetical protein